MNCDEVFAILTRGPFPSGDRHDRLVESHLQLCLDCQRLAEALRPNDENRPEAVAPEDTVSLPGYWGGPLNADIHPILSLAKTAGQSQPQPKRTQRARKSQRQSINFRHFTAAVVLGIVVAAVLRTLIAGSELPRNTIPGSGGYGSGNLLDPFDHQAALNGRPTSCVRNLVDPDRLLADSENGGYSYQLSRVVDHCCDRCHHAGNSLNPLRSEAKAELRRNCAACHEWIRP
jgi:hypothetical protein